MDDCLVGERHRVLEGERLEDPLLEGLFECLAVELRAIEFFAASSGLVMQ